MSVLHGIRVLDFGRYVAGPYCATLLGYLGAEVIRVEKRDGGEDRYIAPLFDGGEGGVFFQTACNKKSVTLDPASAAAARSCAGSSPRPISSWSTCRPQRSRRWVSTTNRCVPSSPT
jgi:hypothetical protein